MPVHKTLYFNTTESLTFITSLLLNYYTSCNTNHYLTTTTATLWMYRYAGCYFSTQAYFFSTNRKLAITIAVVNIEQNQPISLPSLRTPRSQRWASLEFQNLKYRLRNFKIQLCFCQAPFFLLYCNYELTLLEKLIVAQPVQKLPPLFETL